MSDFGLPAGSVSSTVVTNDLPTTMAPNQLTPEEQAMLGEDQAPIPMTDSPVQDGQMIGPVLSPIARNTFGSAMYGLVGLPIGLADTMGQSLGVFDKDTVEGALNQVSPQGLGDFYARNKTALRTGGEIVGVFLPGMAATKVMKSVQWAREAGTFGASLRDSVLVDRLLGNAAKLTSLEQKVANAARQTQQKFGVFSGKTFANDPALAAAARSLTAGKVAENVRQTVAFEAGYRVLYNNSETMNMADYTLSDQLKWGTAFGAGSAALELVASRYAVRKIIQGVARATQEVTSNPVQIAAASNRISEAVFRPGARGVGVTQFAALKSELKTIRETATSPTLATNLKQDEVVIDGVLHKQIDEMAYDQHPIISRTKLTDDQKGLIMTALKEDETTLLYSTKLGHVPQDPQEFYGSINKLREKTQAALDKANVEFSNLGPKSKASPAEVAKTMAPLRQARKEAEAAYDEMHYVIEGDGSWSDYQSRAWNFLDANDFKAIKRTPYQEKIATAGSVVEARRSFFTAEGYNFKLHDNFVLEIPKSAGPKDWSGAFAASSKFIKDYKPVLDKDSKPLQKFVLNEKTPWFQIEGTLALAAKHPDVAQQIVYDGKLANQSDAMFEVLDQKYQQFVKLMDRTERRPLTGGTILDRVGAYTPAEVRQMLNLPNDIGGRAHPLLQVFAEVRLQGNKTLKDAFLRADKDLLTPNLGLDLLQQTMRETANVADASKQFKLSGGLFQQNDVRPVFVAGRTIPYLSRNDQVVHSLIEANRDNVIQRLGQLNEATAPLVTRVIRALTGLAGLNEAKNVQAMQEGVLSGRGVFTDQTRINNQDPVLKAMSLISQSSEKEIEAYLGGNTLAPGLFDRVGLPDKVGAIMQQKNHPVLMDANRGIHAYRFGWDIKGIVPAPNGGVRFALNKDSPINQRLFEQFFPHLDEAADRLYMPDMSVTARGLKDEEQYTALQIHKDAGALLHTISELSKQSGYENNAVKWAMGASAIKIRDFHLPTPELGREGTWFVKNEANKVVATYSGPISTENRRNAEKAVTSFSADGEKHIAISLDDIRRQHNMFDDDAFFNLIDYADQLAKDGKGIQGGLAKAQIDIGPETLKSMLNSLTRQYLTVGTRARALVFEPQLNYATQASQVHGFAGHFKELNIWDRYKSVAYNSAPVSPEGALTKAYNMVENVTDSALSWAYAHAAELSATTEEGQSTARNLKNLVNKNSSPNLYKQYQEQMKNWSPFEDTQAWLESTYRETVPRNTRQIMAKVAKVSSTMALRFLDAGTAVLNMASVATNAPGVISFLRPYAGETAAQHASRTASWGIEWSPGIRTLSSMKAMSNTSRALYSGELSEPMARAASMGYFQAEYAAMAKVFGENTVGSKNKFERLVDGASWLADSSDVLSKQLSWGMGYKIAKDLGKFDDERNAFLFALNFSNDMIGNYSPKNKPIMFQGALGLPLGSFQTYMFNFYRRMFEYVERKDYRTLAATYAAQASLFGAKSVPGFGAFNSAVLDNDYTGENVDTRLHQKLPETAYELLMHGSLSSIPAIFGEGGLAFYTRGSVDMTKLPPTPMDLQASPPFQFLANTGEGIRRTIANTFGAGGFSLQEQEEILANFSTNRFMKNVMEMAANAKTDRQGQIVVSGTQDMMHLATLITGAQPTHIQNLVEAYNSQRQVELNQTALRTRLNNHTRSMMRGGEFDVDDLQDLVGEYTKSGGNPAFVGEWLRNTLSTSITPKADRKLKELMGSQRGTEFMNMLTAIQQR